MKVVINEIKRLNAATGYSMKGYVHAWKGEAAFRLEVIAAAILLPTALLLNVTTLERLALVGCVVLVLIVELLNSAVEAAVDRVGTEMHPLSGQAKDLGSAAVFTSLLFCGFTWISILFF